jgi:hypothetical protein
MGYQRKKQKKKKSRKQGIATKALTQGVPNSLSNASRHQLNDDTVAADNASNRANNDVVSADNVPNYSKNGTVTTDQATNQTNHDKASIVEQYKEANGRFYHWMAQACPESNMSAVNDYRHGVQQILKHNYNVYCLSKQQSGALQEITNTNTSLKTAKNEKRFIIAPPAIMTSLATCIRLREKLTIRIYGSKKGGDDGHRYIIDVLKYCRSALRYANRMATAVHKEENNRTHETKDNRFHALTPDPEDEQRDCEQIESNIKEGKLPKYTGVQVKEKIDIHQIYFEGDDRIQAVAFLNTMDELMGTVRHHYQLLKIYMRGGQATHPSLSSVQLAMECAMVANVATETVARAEHELALDHPHLSSFYRVLALVFLTECVADINKRIKKTHLKADAHMALAFVADIVECCFHGRFGLAQIPLIAKEFAEKSGVKPQYANEMAEAIRADIALETLLVFEQRFMRCSATAIAFFIEPESHMWLGQCENIGGEFCLLNTHKLVQMFTVASNEMKSFAGLWGPPFDENIRPARRIRGDMDEAFVTNILPGLVQLCNTAPFDHLPTKPHLITVIELLRRHTKDVPTDSSIPHGRKVSAALSFGLHAVLMSSFTLQGKRDLLAVSFCLKESYRTLFTQLRAESHQSKTPENAPPFYHNIRMFKSLAKLANSHHLQKDRKRALEYLKSESVASWSPLIGGELMLYATHVCSIDLGSATIDSLGQLRITLHLYNALKLRDPFFGIPLLESMDKIFKNVKAVWTGGKPKRGSCCAVFCMSWGISATQAARLAFKHAAIEDTFPEYIGANDRKR